MKDEFVKVECTDGEPIYTEFFSFPRNPYGPKEPEFNNALNQTDKLSVLLVGFDGMSRLNFLRQMPRTLEFIESHGAISLLGYNKVGYNTFPNVLPVLNGHSEGQLKKTCWRDKNAVFDNCSFIWDSFKKQGYVTAYGEDTPFMGTFWYLKNGFRKKPVDFYPRPLNLEAERHIASNHRLNVNLCLGNKLSSRVFNNLIKSFSYSFRNQLTFGFFWGNSLTHDFLNLPRVGDEDFRGVLSYLEKIGTFNRTMIVLLSDHGIRWGDFRTTYQGFLEERLPFVYFVFPEWFREKYSTAMANLQVNRKRLTSPFDLHETLKDVLNLTGISDDEVNKPLPHRGNPGVSLFRPVSSERKCQDAGIPEDWCACHTNKPLPVSSKETQEAAASVVVQINSLLTGYRQCATLKISKLVSARLEEVPNKESLKYSFKDLIVTLETEPGRGLFEATVRYKINAGYTVIGAISRLNMYGNQSSCISNYALKLYCYCS